METCLDMVSTGMLEDIYGVIQHLKANAHGQLTINAIHHLITSKSIEQFEQLAYKQIVFLVLCTPSTIIYHVVD